MLPLRRMREEAMPDVELTEMDLAVVECVYSLGHQQNASMHAGDLVACLLQRFPEYDKVSMREGESITRLRGRQLLRLEEHGRLSLTESGVQMAEGLRLGADE